MSNGPLMHSSAVLLRAAMVIALAMMASDGPLFSQTESKINFRENVLPLLKERCISCHGPSLQMNGYRLDRRSGALGGPVRPNIVPRSGDTSRLYRRLIGSQFGSQMPPTGALSQSEIDIFKRWIDEGAEWPDALANEADLPAENPAATRLAGLIRSADRKAVLEQIKSNPAVANARGPGGSTPLMYAALYGDAGLMAEMLRAGADPDLRNNAGASALMWALDDLEKVRSLLDRGTDVNAVSDLGRTPLMLASAQKGSAEVVKLLLDRGAKATPAALAAAASRGDVAVVRLLLAAGARDTGAAAAGALRSNCYECFDAIIGVQPKLRLPNALVNILPPAGAGDPEAVQRAIEHGANVNAKDPKSRTVLMEAAILERIHPESLQLLIEHGADVHAKDPSGFTALDFAKRLGATPSVDLLTKAGGETSGSPSPTLTFVKANTIPLAVERSLPLLQRTGREFYSKSGCVSCHHNSLTAMTVATARKKGFAVDESLARQDLTTTVRDIGATTDQALQGVVTPGGFVTTTGYILMGLSAEHHPSSAATDALVRLLKLSQQSDGHWASAYRPPFEASEITATAVSLRGIQLYGRDQWQRGDHAVIAAATSWLENAHAQSTEDRVFRLLGLTWAGASTPARQSAMHDLITAQRSDGGWAQLTSLQSDAYATGESLFALHEAGVRPDDPTYRRGIQFLLSTQLVDGSWFVRTRAHPTQTYFESGFPHGTNQFISAAATNWATLALVLAH